MSVPIKLSLLFWLCCIITTKSVFAQSITNLYALENSADSLEKAGIYNQAIEILLKTSKFPNTAPFDEKLLTKLFLLKKNNTEAEKHLRLGISRGLDTDKLNNEPLIKAFINRPDFQAVYQQYRKVYNNSLLCPDERLELAQMVERDQFPRSYVGKVKTDVIYPKMRKVDSANTEEFKEMIQRIGFPGIKQVGIDGEQNAFTILLHIFLDGVNDEADIAYFEPIMKNAVLDGSFDPHYFTIIVDRYYSMKFNYQVYGSYWVPDKATKLRAITTIKEIDEVDKRRTSIYLPPLIKLKDNGYLLPENYTYKK
jgi:hypothetical protein